MVRRDGYLSWTGSLRYSFRPGRWGIRRVTIRPNGDAFESLELGVRESSAINLTVELELDNGDELSIRQSRESELFVVLDERTADDGRSGRLRERDLAVKISYRLFL